MRSIEYSRIVEASLTDVWDAWTTDEGVRTFFSEDSKVDLRVGGAYELYFNPSDPIGARGSEGMQILSYIPERMFSFEWNNPPSIPELRDLKTWVVLEFNELDEDLCEATLTHVGFGEGELWDQSYQYFLKSWDTVLNRFVRSLRMGAIDWEHPPKLS